jgi:hypothetical protein
MTGSNAPPIWVQPETLQGQLPLVRLQQVPAPIDDDGRVRFLLVEHVVECFAHGCQGFCAEIGRGPRGRSLRGCTGFCLLRIGRGCGLKTIAPCAAYLRDARDRA